MRRDDDRGLANMALAVVTGANRGIGLELVRQLAGRGSAVVAVCRRRSPELDALGVRVEDDCDITRPEVWSALAQRLATEQVDLLVHNAGMLVADRLVDVRPDGVRAQFELNALAPLFLTRALLPRMRAGAKVALVTSRMGSMGDNGSGGQYGYRMSKAALNAAGVSLAMDLKPRGIAVVILHPGPVRTGMTGGHGSIDADEAVRGLLRRIDELGLETTGRFLHQNGETLPW
jgi:NAD(P)-dependent dehydrogenase (short-subunit alcohol dehydrogenase family)